MKKEIFLYLSGIFFITNVYGSDIESDSSSVKQYFLEEVTVLSSKETGNTESLPVAASIFSPWKLKSEDIRTSKDLTSKIPNFFMPDYGSKINSPVYIRGIGSKVNAPSIGLYIDNMPFFEKCTYDIDLADVKQLEVLRGPQGTLYGRNTMGGIINIYTKSPFDFEGMRIDLSGGNYGNYSGKVSSYNKLSEKLGLMVAANYLHRDGYFENVYRDEKADKMDDAGGKLKLSYKLSDALLMELSGNITYSNQYGYPYGLADSTGVFEKIFYNEKSGYEQLVATSGLSVKYNWKNMIFTSTTSYQWFDDQQKIDQDFTSDSIYFVVQKMRQNMVAQELTLRSNSSRNYQWVVGTFGFYQAIRKTVDMDYRKLRYTTDKNYINDTKGLAFYHQSTYNNLLIERLSADIGIRFDLENSKQDYKPYKIDSKGTSTPQTPYNSELDFSEFVPKFNLMYTLRNESKIYASVAKGYKTGGFNDSFQKDEDRTFDPEYSWNYELGYKFSLLNQMIKGDLTLFYIDWKNQQISCVDPTYNPPVPILKNAGKSESKGIEAGLSIYPCDHLVLDIQYGYTHAIFTDYKKDEKTDFSDNFIPYIPKNTFSLTANYSIPIRKFIDQMTIMAQYNGTGSLYWEDANAYKQDYYGLLNARVTFNKGNHSLSLWGRNLTGTDYNAYLFTMNPRVFCQQGKPLTLGIDLTFFL